MCLKTIQAGRRERERRGVLVALKQRADWMLFLFSPRVMGGREKNVRWPAGFRPGTFVCDR